MRCRSASRRRCHTTAILIRHLSDHSFFYSYNRETVRPWQKGYYKLEIMVQSHVMFVSHHVSVSDVSECRTNASFWVWCQAMCSDPGQDRIFSSLCKEWKLFLQDTETQTTEWALAEVRAAFCPDADLILDPRCCVSAHHFGSLSSQETRQEG